MSIEVRFRRRPGTEDLPAPGYQSAHAAGMDLHAAVDEPVRVEPGEVKLIPTGLFVEIPPGCEGQIRARSGLALKHGLMLPNSPGTIDADYRGEVQVIVANVSRAAYEITRGQRFAQLVIARVEQARMVEVTDLSETARAAGGFGHTGR